MTDYFSYLLLKNRSFYNTISIISFIYLFFTINVVFNTANSGRQSEFFFNYGLKVRFINEQPTDVTFSV